MNQRSADKLSLCIVLAVAVAVAVAWTLCYYWHHYDGDDIAYMLELTDHNGVGHGRNTLWELPLLAAKHWVLNNGRAANIVFTIPMLSLLPKWFNAAVCGFLFFSMLLLACWNTGALRHRSFVTCVAVTAAFALLFPWWNEGFQFCVAMNYVATSAFILGLVALRPLTAFIECRRWLCAAFAFVTGMMHESASIALTAGIVVSLCLNCKSVDLRKVYGSLSFTDRLLLKSFAVGAAVAVLSPGIWMRFFRVQTGARQHYDGTLLSLLLSTLPLLLLLLALGFLMALSASGRVRLRRLSADRIFVFWAISALTASVFVFAGRLAGNSGWFAELFSLCALGRMAVVCLSDKRRLWTVCGAAILAAVVVVHSFYVAAAQRRNYEAVEQIRAMYMATDDEVVFCDVPEPFTNDVLLLDRVHDVNNGDAYTSTVLASFYGRRNMLVLPCAYRDADLDSLLTHADSGFLKVNDEIMLAGSVPSSAEPVGYWSGARGWYYIDSLGMQYTVMPFRLGSAEYYAFITD